MSQESSNIGGSWISALVKGGFLSSPWLIANWPFLLLIMAFGFISIASTHAADNKVREMESLADSLKNLKAEFVLTRREAMNRTRITTVQSEAKALGLQKSRAGIYKVEP